MPSNLSNRQRLLMVQDILKKYTDEQNQLTIREIIIYQLGI
ncbi:hypothetical protein [Anaerobacillus sp. CMMVII]|nr:hypothetical protein [Anaerobacillus sp. CMMVII]